MALARCAFNKFDRRFSTRSRNTPNKFRIVAGSSVYGWKPAATEQDAIREWLIDYGYRSLDQAAKEHFCTASDIRAVKR
jgi:hypothetical protein